MKFIIEIELGNDAMKSVFDIAKALKKVSSRLVKIDRYEDSLSERIKDDNGNTVGRWKFSYD